MTWTVYRRPGGDYDHVERPPGWRKIATADRGLGWLFGKFHELQIEFTTGGDERKSDFRITIGTDDFEELLSCMMDVSETATVNAFAAAWNARVKERVRQDKAEARAKKKAEERARAKAEKKKADEEAS